MKNKGLVTAVTGVSTLATGIASNVFAGGLANAASVPTCDASATSSQVSTKVSSANSGITSAFLASTGKALHADTVKKDTAYKKAKGAAKASALKALNVAKAKEAAALSAYKKLNSYSIFTSSPTAGTALPRSGKDGNWTWGDYTTQVVIKGGKLLKVCTSVDETNAGNNLGEKATEADADISKNSYQGIGAWNADAPGNLEILFHAAVYSPATSASKIAQNVQTCALQAWDNTSAPCVYGGISGATYSADAFKKSLTSALAKAKTAGAIAN